MRITVHQPDFLPWLGFFDRWAKSDLLVILDDVQFSKGGWQNRDRIKAQTGPAWLTVPIKKSGRAFQLTRDVEIDNDQPWRKKHLHTIEQAYKRAPSFERCFARLSEVYNKGQSLLTALCVDLLGFLAEDLGIRRPLVYSSAYEVQGTATERLVNLMERLGGHVYLTGLGSKGYLDEHLFEQHGMRVEWQQFEHPVYSQLHGDFIPNLSALDYVMMVPAPDLFRWSE